MSAGPFQQAQAEGLCLRFPDNLGLHREVTYEMAVNMLLRATLLAQTVPFSWGFIDKPPEGQLLLLFLPPQGLFPLDGIRYQDQEVKFTISAGMNRELEIHEIKFGFIPGTQDTNAWRVRRRYRLTKGGHSQLVLVHYTQGPQTHILPGQINQPARHYPLRIVNEPSVFVSGEKMGTKVFPAGGPPTAGPPPQMMAGASPGPMPGFGQPHAMVTQQNNSMEMLERRREQERVRNRAQSTSGRPPPPDDDSGDETDQISTRTLALNRYRRNHDFMNEIFTHAAFSDKNVPPPRPYSIFNVNELKEKEATLQAQIDLLKTKHKSSGHAQGVSDHRTTLAMDIVPNGIVT